MLQTEINEYLELYNEPLEVLVDISSKIASKNFNNKVNFCSLISAKTGKCSQNCKYCAQSSHYNTSIATHPLVELEDVKKASISAKENGASHFAVVTSGKLPSQEELQKLSQMIEIINEQSLSSCASLGIMPLKDLLILKNAGLKRFHHNINTCKSYHNSICTTHSYQDRIDTTLAVREAGLELCCGVIIGMGETKQQRIEMAMELSQIAPDSVPINILDPIKGTPFESFIDKITEEEILKTIAIFRIIMPNTSLRFAGGRIKRLSHQAQKQGIIAGVDSMIVGNLLTTIGQAPQNDLEMIQECGKTL